MSRFQCTKPHAPSEISETSHGKNTCLALAHYFLSPPHLVVAPAIEESDGEDNDNALIEPAASGRPPWSSSGLLPALGASVGISRGISEKGPEAYVSNPRALRAQTREMWTKSAPDSRRDDLISEVCTAWAAWAYVFNVTCMVAVSFVPGGLPAASR